MAQGPPMPPGVPLPAPQPEAKADDQCTVGGTVLNSVTKQPLGKARVGLMRMDRSAGAPAATTTDASGRFKLTGVPPGPYLVTVTRNGFSRKVVISGNAPPSLTLAPKQALKDLTQELAPAAVIAGRVVDQDGEPMAAEDFQSLHDFEDDLAAALGEASYYNLALGTVSTYYRYDRLKDRDSGVPKRPWE
jgi:hypothetical protein